MNNKIRLEEVKEITGFDEIKIKRLIELDELEFDGENYGLNKVLQYLEKEENIRGTYFTIRQAVSYLGLNENEYTLLDLKKIYAEYFSILEILNTEVSVDRAQVFIKRKSVERFKQETMLGRGTIFLYVIDVMKLYGWGHQKVLELTRNEGKLKIIGKEQFNGIRICIKSVELVAKEYGDFEKWVRENYFSIGDTNEQLGFKRTSAQSSKRLAESGLLEWIKLEKRLDGALHWFTKKSVADFKRKIKDEYVKCEYVVERTGLTYNRVKNLFNTEEKFVFNNIIYIEKEAAMKVVSIDKSYYTLAELYRITGKELKTLEEELHKGKFHSIITDIVEPTEENENWYFNKKEVDSYLEKIGGLEEQYFSKSELFKYLGLSESPILNPVKYISTPEYMRLLKARAPAYLYSREGARKYGDDSVLKNKIFNSMNTKTESILITILEHMDFQLCLSETKRYIQQYTEVFFSTVACSDIGINRYARDLIRVAEYISELTMKKELYHFDDVEIQVIMENCKAKTHRVFLYNILNYISEKRICKYKIKNHVSPHSKIGREKKEKEVLDFETFKDIYEFCREIDLHIDRAISNKKYASLWLYVMVLLTNSWRHSDVLRIPSINPELIGVSSIDWFKYNKLNAAQGQKIVNIIYSLRLVTAKNGMPRDFTCNYDLIIPMVTAMCICEFHRRKTNIPFLIDVTDGVEEIINKKGKKTQEIRRSYLKNNFLKYSSKLKDVSFSSLIANRSLMEHLYYSIKEKKGKGNSTFELMMKYRSHKSTITQEYIGFDGNKTSLQLFDRGEFGFVFDRLVEVISPNTQLTIQGRTQEIKRINKFFNPIEVENLFGFLKEREVEKQALASKLLTTNPNDALELTRKMYLGEIPAKQKHVQCLTYPKCHRESNQFSCVTCPFAIHNVYTLTSIFNEFEDRLKIYLETDKNGVRKRELKNIICIQDVILEAIDQFGQEYVFSFYTGGENMFEEKLSLIDEQVE